VTALWSPTNTSEMIPCIGRLSTMAAVALRASVTVLLVGVQALPAMRSWVSMLVQGAVEVPR
jgi:hypothetical protein